MSDFLTNLAHRGAGLGPIAARPAHVEGVMTGSAGPESGDEAARGTAEPASPAESGGASGEPAHRRIAVRAQEPSDPPHSSHHAASAATPPTVSTEPVLPLAPDSGSAVRRSPTEAVQAPHRTVAPGNPPPVAPRWGPTAAIPTAPAAATAMPAPIVPVPAAAPLTERGAGKEPRTAARNVLPVPPPGPSPLPPSADARYARVDVHRDPQELSQSPDGGHRDDGTLAPPALPPPPAVTEPAVSAVPPAPAPAARSAAPPERVVQVRIGTIEIHGAPPPEAAGPAPAAPEQPGDRPTASPSAGFDEFAGLRSYAPWGR